MESGREDSRGGWVIVRLEVENEDGEKCQTKLAGIEWLLVLVKRRPVACVLGSLPNWVSIYLIMSFQNDTHFASGARLFRAKYPSCHLSFTCELTLSAWHSTVLPH